MKNLSKSTVAVVLSFLLTMGAFQKAKALDVVLLIPNSLTNSELFLWSKQFANEAASPNMVVAIIGIFWLPIGILSEQGNSKSISVSDEKLSELGYTNQEISTFEAEVQAINQINAMEPSDEKNMAISNLKLSPVTKEIFNLKP